MPFSSTTKRRLVVYAAFFGLFTALALLTALGAYVSAGTEHSIALGPLFRQEFKDWYACGFISLGVLWFCNRNRLEPGEARRWALTHFAGACVASALFIVLASWLVAGEQSVMHPEKILTFTYLLKNTGIHLFILNLIIYWVIVFGHLGWHFYQRYREREVQTEQLQRELSEARLEALRMQLNPHFLFNTLHAISALIHEQPEAADRMVARLSELLRLTLDPAKPQEVPLSEELAFLDGYLQIEQTRFAERLRVTREIEPQTQAALVPFLILQPLVENAIRHGIEPRDESGRLAIRARRQDGMLELRITDDGPGLPSTDTVSARQGIGLANTRSRLRHLYGEESNLELADLAEGGLEARITLPFHTHATPNREGE